MKIRNKNHKIDLQVYGISVHAKAEWSFKDRVIFYVAQDGFLGLGSEGLSEIEVVDNSLSDEFNLHTRSDEDGFLILWRHFKDIEHLARLIDLDPDTVTAFEEARKARIRPPSL
ncbi:hypothetical protein [Mesorhizobium sp.]|uniref:hypothetical protein n=1 Tax=Mesorhizobium sp. TaxID=1871066 RepID=UPI000FE48394|nr:hypothetical protein [Mesorhizobium sp.]RWC26762.1 MAG: hypothetical protein EOS27_24050 [Mesorhizobium sp.]TIW94533.1 MAG: hypothetical protein E5V59_13535 [Mesorhizobium sp.]TIX25831.1 MAG: hypothetical protein E5V35_12970 [Mesorhizobium sp.]